MLHVNYVSVKEEDETAHRHIERPRKDGGEIRVMLPQDMEAPETGRSKGEFSLEPLEGVWHDDTLSLNSGKN